MKRGRSAFDRILPWLGIVAALVGWGVSHQVGSNAVFDDCRVGGPWFVILVCVAGLALALAGGLCSFVAWRRRGAEGEGAAFMGLVGALLALLAAFAILLQAASALILPECAA